MKIKNLIQFGVLGISFFLASCTKQREEKFPDGQGNDIFEKSLFENAHPLIEVGNQPENQTSEGSVRASEQTQTQSVTSVQTNSALKPMFKDLQVKATGGATYSVTFQLNKKYITAYKEASNNGLSLLEKQMGIQSNESTTLVPIFQYKIQAYGKVIRIKNDLEEETHLLRLEPTEWDDASHVQVSMRKSDRIEIQSSSEDLEEEIFIASKINGMTLSRKKISESMNIQLNRPNDQLIKLFINGTSIQFFEVLSELPSDLKDFLDSGDSRVKRCSSESKNCFLVLIGETSISYVTARRKMASDGTLTSEVEYIQVSPEVSQELVQINKDPEISEWNPSEERKVFDPKKLISLKDLQGEFLFRRTLQDSPHAFDFTFPGASGKLEIVRFQTTAEELRVLRADSSVLNSPGESDVDKQTLMVLPVKYFERVHTDSNGNALEHPRWVETSHENNEAVAIVDWAKNQIPNVSSPLNYYELGQCFSGENSTVSQMNSSLDKGTLNFTLHSTYTSNPSIDCAGIYQAGYFDQVQTHFTFKERVSFLKYNKDKETPLLDVPYEAQKKLGFGIFTYKKKKPNEFGNTGTDGTEVPLPAIFDLSQGKKIHYQLSGLPSSKALRAALIQATKEVIHDVNSALSKAFQGTEMESDEDYVVLTIEGSDSTSVLGDLNVNTIHYVEKKTSSGIIGLGGAHSNPRSGEVEAASSFIYGGNILSYVERLRRMSRSKGEAPSSGNRKLPSFFTPQSIPHSPLSQARSFIENLSKPGGLVQIESSLRQLLPQLKNYSEKQRTLEIPVVRPTANELATRKTSVSPIGFQKALDQLIKEKNLGNERKVALAMNEHLAEIRRDQLSSDDLAQLQVEVNRQKAALKVMNQMRGSEICLHGFSHSLQAGMETLLKDPQADNTDVLISIYKPTLAHEIGHNLGLRHNFMGSYDQKNFLFSSEENTSRNYSSIMDYLPNDHHTYDGFGPQDVASIRAAYAGLLELDSRVIDLLPEENGKKFLPFGDEKMEIINNQFISIENYKKAIGVDSWINLTSEHMARLPLKSYEFCSDEDVLYAPICNRFDQGGTPQEIVASVAADYRGLYEYRNFAQDRLRFGWWDDGVYIGRLFSQLLPVRQFLEETLYQLVSGAPSSVVQDYLNAAIEGLFLFHEIIRTPDAPSFAQNEERFLGFDFGLGPYPIERKWIQNIGNDQSNRIQVRGIELDKAIALILLTERRLGFPRYERVSLRFSYPELEKLLIEDENPMTHPTIGLLTEILNNNLKPSGYTPFGTLNLDSQFKTSTTELMRFYAVIGSAMSLDVEGLEASDNLSAHFRVMSGFSTPRDIQGLVQPGANPESPNILKYWADESGVVASHTVEKGLHLEKLREVRGTLDPIVSEWAVLRFSTDEDSEGNKEKIQKLETEINSTLNQLPEGLGPTQIEEMAPLLEGIQAVVKQLQDQGSEMSSRQFRFNLDLVQTQIERIVKDSPTFAIGLEAMKVEQLGLSLMNEIFPSFLLDIHQGTQFSNVELLNSIYYTVHALSPAPHNR